MRVLLLAMALAACAPPAVEEMFPLAWFEGSWISCSDGVEVIETWSRDGEVLAGVNTTRRNADAEPSIERMRLVVHEGGGASFFALVADQPETEFRAPEANAARLVFENAAHDFPQRVIYERDGDDLVARIEGEIEGAAESMDWRFRPARGGETCF